MLLQGNSTPRYQHRIRAGKIQTALRMLRADKLSSEEIALYSGIAIEKVLELKDHADC